MTPIPTSNKSGKTYRGNRRGSSRRGNEGGTRGSEQKDFKGETPELNAVLGLITEILDQGVTLEKSQEVLKNYVLNNFHKAEDIVEMVTNLKDPFPNFDPSSVVVRYLGMCFVSKLGNGSFRFVTISTMSSALWKNFSGHSSSELPGTFLK